MFLWIFLFVVFIIVLWQSSNRALLGVKRVARAFGVSEIAVTLLALSILASFPELMVSVLAALKHTSDVSLGTVLGSNIFTLLVVLGLAAIIRPFHVKMIIEERDSVWLLLSSSVILIFMPGGISRLEGILLVILYFPYIYSVYIRERKKRTDVSAKMSGSLKKGKEVLLFVGVTFIMLVSAEVVLRSSLKLSEIFYVPKLVMSLVLIGIGASIPETAIGISSALETVYRITTGRVIRPILRRD